MHPTKEGLLFKEMKELRLSLEELAASFDEMLPQEVEGDEGAGVSTAQVASSGGGESEMDVVEGRTGRDAQPMEDVCGTTNHAVSLRGGNTVEALSADQNQTRLDPSQGGKSDGSSLPYRFPDTIEELSESFAAHTGSHPSSSLPYATTTDTIAALALEPANNYLPSFDEGGGHDAPQMQVGDSSQSKEEGEATDITDSEDGEYDDSETEGQGQEQGQRQVQVRGQDVVPER